MKSHTCLSSDINYCTTVPPLQNDTVKEALEAYESVRKPPTSAIMLSSRVIGFVETGAGPVGLVRDAAFAALGTAVGVDTRRSLV